MTLDSAVYLLIDFPTTTTVVVTVASFGTLLTADVSPLAVDAAITTPVIAAEAEVATDATLDPDPDAEQ